MTFTDRLEKLIEEKSVSKKEFSEKVGITTQALYDWKKRNTVPSADIACKIADFLNTTVEYLVTGNSSDIYKDKYENLKKAVLDAVEKTENQN